MLNRFYQILIFFGKGAPCAWTAWTTPHAV